jgi:hypothetical protein
MDALFALRERQRDNVAAQTANRSGRIAVHERPILGEGSMGLSDIRPRARIDLHFEISGFRVYGLLRFYYVRLF